MARSQKKQGHKGLRAKSGSESYYKGKYYISFYKDDGDDEIFYAGFNNVVEICKYNGWEVNTSNINMIHQALYKALYEKEEPYTKLIDGVRLKIYLIDMTDEIKENERREKYMKKFVKITSTINIEVYPDLQAIDTTNPNAPMADRLNAKPNWVYPILIESGTHFYPSEIKEWKSVKALDKKKVITIANEVDEPDDDEKERCEKLRQKIKKFASRPQVKKVEGEPKATAEN